MGGLEAIHGTLGWGYPWSRFKDISEVDTPTPLVQVTNNRDVDEDLITYTFQVYADDSMGTLVTSASGIPEGKAGPPPGRSIQHCMIIASIS